MKNLTSALNRDLRVMASRAPRGKRDNTTGLQTLLATLKKPTASSKQKALICQKLYTYTTLTSAEHSKSEVLQIVTVVVDLANFAAAFVSLSQCRRVLLLGCLS